MLSSLPRIWRSNTARTVAVFASGNMVAMVLGLVGSLVQARYILPESMGVFRSFTILAGYLTFLHLGTFDGLQREIPLQMGRGNQAGAERAAAACLSWITLVSVGSGALFLVLAVRAALLHEWMHFWGWLAHLPFIAGTFYAGYLNTTFRSGAQFVALSKINIYQALAGTLILPLLPVLGYYGACLRIAVISVTQMVFLHLRRPMKMAAHFDRGAFREVIRVGLPLSAIGYLSTSLWVSLEGTMVLGWYGTEALGLYSVAVFMRTIVVQLALNLNQVLNVKMLEQYGRTGRVVDCLRLILIPVSLAFLTSLPLIAVAWILLPWAVAWLTPNYFESVFMMQLVLVAMPITFLRLPGAILWAAARQFDCFLGVAVGFVVFVGCAYAGYRLGYGMKGVVIASMLGQVASVMATYLLIWRLANRENRPLCVA